MASHDDHSSSLGDGDDRGIRAGTYVPPLLERLGSLAELTLGGKGDPDDGFGGAGDEGSV